MDKSEAKAIEQQLKEQSQQPPIKMELFGCGGGQQPSEFIGGDGDEPGGCSIGGGPGAGNELVDELPDAPPPGCGGAVASADAPDYGQQQRSIGFCRGWTELEKRRKALDLFVQRQLEVVAGVPEKVFYECGLTANCPFVISAVRNSELKGYELFQVGQAHSHPVRPGAGIDFLVDISLPLATAPTVGPLATAPAVSSSSSSASSSLFPTGQKRWSLFPPSASLLSKSAANNVGKEGQSSSPANGKSKNTSSATAAKPARESSSEGSRRSAAIAASRKLRGKFPPSDPLTVEQEGWTFVRHLLPKEDVDRVRCGYMTVSGSGKNPDRKIFRCSRHSVCPFRLLFLRYNCRWQIYTKDAHNHPVTAIVPFKRLNLSDQSSLRPTVRKRTSFSPSASVSAKPISKPQFKNHSLAAADSPPKTWKSPKGTFWHFSRTVFGAAELSALREEQRVKCHSKNTLRCLWSLKCPFRMLVINKGNAAPSSKLYWIYTRGKHTHSLSASEGPADNNGGDQPSEEGKDMEGEGEDSTVDSDYIVRRGFVWKYLRQFNDLDELDKFRLAEKYLYKLKPQRGMPKIYMRCHHFYPRRHKCPTTMIAVLQFDGTYKLYSNNRAHNHQRSVNSAQSLSDKKTELKQKWRKEKEEEQQNVKQTDNDNELTAPICMDGPEQPSSMARHLDLIEAVKNLEKVSGLDSSSTGEWIFKFDENTWAELEQIGGQLMLDIRKESPISITLSSKDPTLAGQLLMLTDQGTHVSVAEFLQWQLEGEEYWPKACLRPFLHAVRGKCMSFFFEDPADSTAAGIGADAMECNSSVMTSEIATGSESICVGNNGGGEKLTNQKRGENVKVKQEMGGEEKDVNMAEKQQDQQMEKNKSNNEEGRGGEGENQQTMNAAEQVVRRQEPFDQVNLDHLCAPSTSAAAPGGLTFFPENFMDDTTN